MQQNKREKSTYPKEENTRENLSRQLARKKKKVSRESFFKFISTFLVWFV